MLKAKKHDTSTVPSKTRLFRKIIHFRYNEKSKSPTRHHRKDAEEKWMLKKTESSRPYPDGAGSPNSTTHPKNPKIYYQQVHRHRNGGFDLCTVPPEMIVNEPGGLSCLLILCCSLPQLGSSWVSYQRLMYNGVALFQLQKSLAKLVHVFSNTDWWFIGREKLHAKVVWRWLGLLHFGEVFGRWTISQVRE